MAFDLHADKLVSDTGYIHVGSSAIAGSKILVEGQEAHILLRFHSTAAATLGECWMMGEGPDAAGVMRKLGVYSFRYADKDTSSGYMVSELHVTKIVAGVSTNEYQWAAWGGRGMAIFPPDIQAANSPGPAVLRVHGSVDVMTNLEVASAIRGFRSGDAAEDNLKLRNSNPGTSAATRMLLGNDAAESAATFAMHSSTHTAKPNTLEILNQLGGPLILGANGNEILRLYSSGVALFQNLVGSEEHTLPDGATVAVDWTNGNNQCLLSPAAGRTFTFTGARKGDHLTLRLLSAGAVNHTLPASVKLIGGGAVPTTSASGKTDLFVAYFDGTNYIGSFLLNA